MKQNKKSFGLMVSAGVLSVALLSACAQRVAIQPTPEPPTATPTPLPTNTPTPLPTATPEIKKTVAAPTPEIVGKSSGNTGNGIAVGSLSDAVPDLKSQQTALTLNLDGTGTGNKALKGTLNASLNNNIAQKQLELVVGGDLLSPLLAEQLRGFAARGLTLYALNDNVYASIQTLLSVCVKPKASQINVAQISEGLSLDTFTRMVAADGTFPGKLVGSETVNGIASKHYTIDTAAFKEIADARGLKDITVSQGDVWLADQGNYVTRLNVIGNGKLSNLANNSFEGNFSLAMELTGVNNSPEVVLPSNCSRAIELP